MSVDFPERFNMADYFLYHNLEEGREDKVCLYYRDQTYTYGEAALMSNRTGNATVASGRVQLRRIASATATRIVDAWLS